MKYSWVSLNKFHSPPASDVDVPGDRGHFRKACFLGPIRWNSLAGGICSILLPTDLKEQVDIMRKRQSLISLAPYHVGVLRSKLGLWIGLGSKMVTNELLKRRCNICLLVTYITMCIHIFQQLKLPLTSRAASWRVYYNSPQ